MIELTVRVVLGENVNTKAESAKLKELLQAVMACEVDESCCNRHQSEPAQGDTEAVTDLAEPGLTKSAETFKPDAVEVDSEEPKPDREEPKAEVKKSKTKKTEKTEAPKIKIEEVRAVLADYRSKGGDLKAVLKPYGTKLSEVKAADYAALLKDAEEALKKLEDAE